MKKIICRAPLRISYAGGGTDLEPFLSQHGGMVINSTINQFAYTTVEEWHSWLFNSVDIDEETQYFTQPEDYTDNQSRLLVNTFIFLSKKYQLPKIPIKVTTTSDVSPGSGLGSSSAVTVSLLIAISNFFNIDIPKQEVSDFAFHIERTLCKFPGGKQDQFASVFGGMRKYDFLKDKTVVNDLYISKSFLNTLNLNTILYDAGGSRPTANSIFHLDDNIIDDNIKNLRITKKSKEQTLRLKENCVLMAKAIESGDLKKMAYIFNENWQIKKQISPTITTKFLDDVYTQAMANGALGGKICGAGGGGHVIFLVEIDKRAGLIKKLNSMAGKVVPFSFNSKGAETWSQ